MTMTPEEKRVVQVAIDLWRTKPEDPAVIELANELRIATEALVYACDGCNYERHLCPGCGTWLPHGDDACEACADDVEHAARDIQGDPPDEPLAWIARTWRDVREGDRVKMPGAPADTAATVIHATAHAWHVDPASSQYRPEPLEWSATLVTLLLADQGERKLNADPDKPVEIELSAGEVAAIEAVGWENRVRIER